MNGSNFVWTDDLVKDFLTFNAKVNGLNPTLEEFKKLHSIKESTIPDKDRDWEIVAFKGFNWDGIYCLAGNGKYNYGTGLDHRDMTLEYALECKFPIHSVRRLMDNTEFSVGDEVIPQFFDESFKIKSFEIKGNKLFVFFSDPPPSYEGGHADINYLRKVKPKVPLFTTADGKNCYEQDTFIVHFITKDWQISMTTPHYAIRTTGYSKIFFDKEKAKEYIYKHKSVNVSFNELYCFIDFPLPTMTIESLKNFFKSKINL